MPSVAPPTIRAVRHLNDALTELQRADTKLPVAPPVSLQLVLPSLRPVLTSSGGRCPSANLQVLIDQWRDALVEFCNRLCNDWSLIAGQFDLPRESKLTSIRSGGDCHAHGRSVLILEFDSGSRLVYKPRCLRAEIRYQQFQTWLNEHGDHPPLRGPAILAPSDDYAWMEFLPHRPCTNEEMLRQFYRRIAANLALLQLLQATDCHCQNVIAARDQPAFIDCEVLFQPRLLTSEQRVRRLPLLPTLADSVERVALLPGSSHFGTQDISGMGLAHQRSTTTRLPLPGGGSVRGASHAPTLNGEPVPLARFSDVFCRQFADTYRLLVSHRAALLDESGPLEAFADAPVRVVLRHSSRYVDLLRQSVGDEQRTAALLHSDVKDRPWLADAVPLEHQALRRNDIPLFLSLPNSRHIWTSDQDQLPNFLEIPGLQLARRRLRAMNEADLANQLMIIRRSMRYANVTGLRNQ